MKYVFAQGFFTPERWERYQARKARSETFSALSKTVE